MSDFGRWRSSTPFFMEATIRVEKKEARRHSQERAHLWALFRTGKPIDELLLTDYWSFSRTASVVVTRES